MIAVTGACGFIGSVLVKTLNDNGIDDLLLVDDFEIDERVGYSYNPNYRYLQNKKFKNVCGLNFNKLGLFSRYKIDFIFHLGAISNTLEKDESKIRKYNVEYTRILSEYSMINNVPVVFASTAAIYGNGDGPLNAYARSKFECEKILEKIACIFRIYNVYGPNEYHKKDMASVLYKWHNQSKLCDEIKLFMNSNAYNRDFIYVEDICKVMFNCYKNYKTGTYDLGTGVSNNFDYLADIFSNLYGVKKTYIDMPEELKYQYQKNTIANTKGLDDNGWSVDFTRISDGINKYVNYLKSKEQII